MTRQLVSACPGTMRPRLALRITSIESNNAITIGDRHDDYLTRRGADAPNAVRDLIETLFHSSFPETFFFLSRNNECFCYER